jgi:hypothetical protein
MFRGALKPSDLPDRNAKATRELRRLDMPHRKLAVEAKAALVLVGLLTKNNNGHEGLLLKVEPRITRNWVSEGELETDRIRQPQINAESVGIAAADVVSHSQ